MMKKIKLSDYVNGYEEASCVSEEMCEEFFHSI